jgi:phytoene dehydrogenase-like protein
MSERYDYDVIIIGAGIGGLVCGCYLAKTGLKVLIVEKNAQPGGYCTSFTRGRHHFDSAIHYIGGVKTGSLSRILSELELCGELEFNQCDPSDQVILPDSQVYVRANPFETINEFKKQWKEEASNIENFFKFAMQSDIISVYRKTIEVNFREFLDTFFRDNNLKSSIGVLLLGNMGLPPSKISAFAAIVFFREFLLDPGYYPHGGMQKFADCLLTKFRQFGGEAIFLTEVTEILAENNKATGVVTSKNARIYAKVLVSGIDATYVFKSLLRADTKEKKVLDTFDPSHSVFIVYLGLKAKLPKVLDKGCNVWLFETESNDDFYDSLEHNYDSGRILGAMLFSPSGKEKVLLSQGNSTLEIFATAPFISDYFWKHNKEKITESVICFAEKLVSNLRMNIDVKVSASPTTLKRYTGNVEGAAFGWASTVEQTNSFLFPQYTSIKNLFLVGHWCIMGGGQGGISTVAVSGKKGAELIDNYFKNKCE